MKTTLHIQNIKCGSCANTIMSRLRKLDNVKDISVNTDDHTVSFNYIDNDDLIAVAELLSKLGYPIDGYSNSLGKKAKSYLSCAIGRFND